MKTIHLMFIAFFAMSSWTLAAQPQAMSLQEQNNINQLTLEMSAQGIPEAPAQKMFSLMQQNGYQELNMVRAQQTVVNTAREGLPTEPVMNKAMEGMAKHVTEEQVIAAMETVRNRYSHAYRLAGALSDDRKTKGILAEAIAGSLAAGMADQEMDTIMAQLRTQTRQQTRNQAENLSLQTMLTVRSMMRLGANPADTSDTVCQALEHRYTAQNMEQLRNRFSDEAQNTPAGQLAHQYAGTTGKKGSDSGGSGSGSSGSGSGGSGNSGSGGGNLGGSGSGGSGSGSSGSGNSGSGNSGSDGSGSGNSGSGNSGSGNSGSDGSGSDGSGSGSSGSGGSGSGGSGSDGSGSSGSGSGGSGSGGSGSGGNGGKH